MDMDIQYQTASFFVTARASSEQSAVSNFYIHANAAGFIESVLGMTVEDFC